MDLRVCAKSGRQGHVPSSAWPNPIDACTRAHVARFKTAPPDNRDLEVDVGLFPLVSVALATVSEPITPHPFMIFWRKDPRTGKWN